MIDQLTYRAVAAKVAVTGFIIGAFERVDRNDRGQGSVEYIGLIVVVIAIIAAVLAAKTSIGETIGRKIQEAVDSVKTS